MSAKESFTNRSSGLENRLGRETSPYLLQHKDIEKWAKVVKSAGLAEK